MTDFAYQIKENYRLCEYIETNLNLNIDTGWKFTKSGQTEIIIDCASTEKTNCVNGCCGFGSYSTSTDESNMPTACCVSISTRGIWRVNMTNNITTANIYEITHCKFNTNNKWSINGVECNEESNVQSGNFNLFGMSAGTGTSYQGGRIYRFIAIEDNKIVKHMVPVINSKNVPGMYDLITKQFYTDSVGVQTFNYRVAHNLLPFGYKECDWIENINGQDNTYPCLSTEWTLTADKVSHSHITLKTQFNPTGYTSADYWAIGSAGILLDDNDVDESNAASYCCFGVFKNIEMPQVCWRANIQTPSSLTIPVIKEPCIGEFRTDNYWYINGTKVPGASDSGATTGPMLLFSRGRSSGSTYDSPTPFRIYYCKIEENDILVRDFVPCVNPEGQVGMFDRVHGKFHSNINTIATKTFKYQVKDQVWPSYLSRVSWIQSTCSYPTATDGVAPYIMLQTQQVDKNNGFKVLVACDNTVQTTPGTNYPGKAILAHRLPNYAGIYWYPKTATQTGPSQFKYGDLTTTAPTAISTADLAKGFNNTYLVEVNYTADNKAEYVNTDTVTTRANTTPTLGNNTNTAPLYLFTSGIHEDFHNTDTHTIRLYDAEVTQYENVIHHYVPCLDTNLNKPCVFDTKTGDIFYEVEDTNVHDHLTYGY